MKKNDEIKLCKNKDCQKVLPKDYKHKLCESCRNKRIDTAKDIVKGTLAVGGTALGVVVTVITKGKFDSSNKG